jgi:hypothetical protein
MRLKRMCFNRIFFVKKLVKYKPFLSQNLIGKQLTIIVFRDLLEVLSPLLERRQHNHLV